MKVCSPAFLLSQAAALFGLRGCLSVGMGVGVGVGVFIIRPFRSSIIQSGEFGRQISDC